MPGSPRVALLRHFAYARSSSFTNCSLFKLQISCSVQRRAYIYFPSWTNPLSAPCLARRSLRALAHHRPSWAEVQGSEATSRRQRFHRRIAKGRAMAEVAAAAVSASSDRAASSSRRKALLGTARARERERRSRWRTRMQHLHISDMATWTARACGERVCSSVRMAQLLASTWIRISCRKVRAPGLRSASNTDLG